MALAPTIAASVTWPLCELLPREARMASASAASEASWYFALALVQARLVALQDVRDFVADHAGELRLVAREQDEAGVHARCGRRSARRR